MWFVSFARPPEGLEGVNGLIGVSIKGLKHHWHYLVPRFVVKMQKKRTRVERI